MRRQEMLEAREVQKFLKMLEEMDYGINIDSSRLPMKLDVVEYADENPRDPFIGFINCLVPEYQPLNKRLRRAFMRRSIEYSFVRNQITRFFRSDLSKGEAKHQVQYLYHLSKRDPLMYDDYMAAIACFEEALNR